MTVRKNASAQTVAMVKTRPYDIHDVGQHLTRVVHLSQGRSITDALTIAQESGRPKTNVRNHRKVLYAAAKSQGQRAI